MNNLLYLCGSITTVICIGLCLILFIICKSKDSSGNKILLYNQTDSASWSLGTWIAGVFVAGTGVALMYAPADLVGYIEQGLNPVESIVMVTLLNGAPVWALYSIMGLWYMKHMDSKIGKIAAMLSTVLGMSISLWTGSNTIFNFIGINLPSLKFIIASFMIGIALLSARFRWLQNISKIAFLVFVVAFLILLATPSTEFIYSPITGRITHNFWDKYFLGSTSASWIFWFLSWTPTVARWLAQISNGRTMKEYIAGTMILPTSLALIWMTISWTHQDLIINFNLNNNIKLLIPCIIFIISGMLFMIGTLDSDCYVFTKDLEYLSKGKVKSNNSIPYYGLFVLFIFCLFISGIIKNPFEFNEYSSLLFIPLIYWSCIECIKIIISYKNRRKE